MKDYTGLKAYNLTMIKPTSQKKSNRAIFWEALCDCGETTHIIPSEVMCGKTKSCGCLGKQASSENGKKRRQYDPRMSSARAAWQQRYSDCDFETFYSLSQKDCYYCGAAPNNRYRLKKKTTSAYQREHGDFIHNGIDRIDSTLGHTPENVVPCCKRCNQAKNNMTIEEFFKMVMSIYNLHLSVGKRSLSLVGFNPE